MYKHPLTLPALLLLAVLTMLACQTTDLVSGVLDPDRPSTLSRTGNNSTTTNNDDADSGDSPDGAIDSGGEYNYDLAGTPRCTVGDSSVSIITGSVTDKDTPVMGQLVQVSSSEGGDPIGAQPNETDGSGNFQVALACGGSACNGSYWVWLIDNENFQVSPSVEFVFDDQCRRGTVNFSIP